jgi:hypothetical protein
VEASEEGVGHGDEELVTGCELNLVYRLSIFSDSAEFLGTGLHSL